MRDPASGAAPGRIPPGALLVGGALCISFSPILVKAAGLGGLGPTAIAFWRLLLGGVALSLLAAVRGASLRLPRAVLLLAGLAGAVFTLDLFLWHRAILLVGAGLATILGNTQVFNTAVLGWLVFREAPRPRFYAAALLGLAGVVLLVGIGGGADLSGSYLRGVVFGLGTGVAYATYLIVSRLIVRRPDHRSLLAVVTWISLLGAAASLSVCGLEGTGLWPRGAGTWWALIGLGVLVQAAGWWAITAALPNVPGTTAGLVLLLQPALATVWGWVLFGERLEPAQIAGAVLTLTAVYLGTVAGRGRTGRPQGRS